MVKVPEGMKTAIQKFYEKFRMAKDSKNIQVFVATDKKTREVGFYLCWIDKQQNAVIPIAKFLKEYKTTSTEPLRESSTMVQEIMKTCLELDPRTVKEMQEDDPRVNLVFATVADQVDDVIIQENIKPELDNFIDEVIKERGNK